MSHAVLGHLLPDICRFWMGLLLGGWKGYAGAYLGVMNGAGEWEGWGFCAAPGLCPRAPTGLGVSCLEDLPEKEGLGAWWAGRAGQSLVPAISWVSWKGRRRWSVGSRPSAAPVPPRGGALAGGPWESSSGAREAHLVAHAWARALQGKPGTGVHPPIAVANRTDMHQRRPGAPLGLAPARGL